MNSTPAASSACCSLSIVDCFASAPFSMRVTVLAVTPAIFSELANTPANGRTALSEYLTAILADTAQNVPGGLDLRQIDALLFDLGSDLIGTLQCAVEGVAGRVA